MKLFYEFQISKNLHLIRASHKQVKSNLKKWQDDEVWDRLKNKRGLVLNALQMYFKKRDPNMTKREIITRYIMHPLMT